MKTENDFLDKVMEKKEEKELRLIGYTKVNDPKGVVVSLEYSGIDVRKTIENFLWELLLKTNPELYREAKKSWDDFANLSSWEQRERIDSIKKKGEKEL